jgi:hypothetical protein
VEVDRVDDHPRLWRGFAQLREKPLRHVPVGEDREAESTYVADRVQALERRVGLDAPQLEFAHVPLAIPRLIEAAERDLPAPPEEHVDHVRDTQQTALAVELRQEGSDDQGSSGGHGLSLPIVTTRACG